MGTPNLTARPRSFVRIAPRHRQAAPIPLRRAGPRRPRGASQPRFRGFQNCHRTCWGGAAARRRVRPRRALCPRHQRRTVAHPVVTAAATISGGPSGLASPRSGTPPVRVARSERLRLERGEVRRVGDVRRTMRRVRVWRPAFASTTKYPFHQSKMQPSRLLAVVFAQVPRPRAGVSPLFCVSLGASISYFLQQKYL